MRDRERGGRDEGETGRNTKIGGRDEGDARRDEGEM